MVAVQDFSAGAMENWGLITYRETALLFKPGVSALTNKERVAMVISHELAHQWFGKGTLIKDVTQIWAFINFPIPYILLLHSMPFSLVSQNQCYHKNCFNVHKNATNQISYMKSVTYIVG